MQTLEGEYLENIINKERLLSKIHKNKPERFMYLYRMYNKIYSESKSYRTANLYVGVKYEKIIKEE